jgi:L-alanine-DL-glutamate epimerase-like enolase superfamily enzyme
VVNPLSPDPGTGEIVLSEEPGLGIELDWDVVDTYRVTGE